MSRVTEFELVDLPRPLAAFRSVASGIPPFLAVLRYFERQTGQELGFPDIAIGPGDWAELRWQTERWLVAMDRLGLPTGEMLSEQGWTAPMINPKLHAGDALVARAVEVAP